MGTIKELSLTVNISYGDANLSEESDSEAMLIMFVLWGVILPLVAAAGLLGNVLTILVLWRREMSSTTILYMRGLVVTDTGILIGSTLVLTPAAVANYLSGPNSPNSHYYLHNIYPRIHVPLFYVVMTLQLINVWITVAVSVERYIAICHPFRAARLITRRKAFIVLASITIFSILYNLPHAFANYAGPCQSPGGSPLAAAGNATNLTSEAAARNGSTLGDYEHYIVASPLIAEDTRGLTASTVPPTLAPTTISPANVSLSGDNDTQKAEPTGQPSCLTIGPTTFGNSNFYQVYHKLMYAIVIYILPFMALLFLNSCLIRELMRMQRRQAATGSHEENEANMSLVLVLIVIVFIFCQTPGLISQFEIIPPDKYLVWLAFSNFLFTANSAVNFLIYTAFGRKFRSVLLRVVRRLSRSKSSRRRRASSASTSYYVGGGTTVANSSFEEKGMEMNPVREEMSVTQSLNTAGVKYEEARKTSAENGLHDYPTPPEARQTSSLYPRCDSEAPNTEAGQSETLPGEKDSDDNSDKENSPGTSGDGCDVKQMKTDEGEGCCRNVDEDEEDGVEAETTPLTSQPFTDSTNSTRASRDKLNMEMNGEYKPWLNSNGTVSQ